MNKPPLSNRQRVLYDYLVAYCDTHKMPPLLREMAVHLGIRPASALDLLTGLVRKGYVTHAHAGKQRAYAPITGSCYACGRSLP